MRGANLNLASKYIMIRYERPSFKFELESLQSIEVNQTVSSIL